MLVGQVFRQLLHGNGLPNRWRHELGHFTSEALQTRARRASKNTSLSLSSRSLPFLTGFGDGVSIHQSGGFRRAVERSTRHHSQSLLPLLEIRDGICLHSVQALLHDMFWYRFRYATAMRPGQRADLQTFATARTLSSFFRKAPAEVRGLDLRLHDSVTSVLHCWHGSQARLICSSTCLRTSWPRAVSMATLRFRLVF